jgi:UDP-glucose 4-epimerase
MRVLVTGAAGFIGSHLAERLLADGHDVTGLDSLEDFYARGLKERNLTVALEHERFIFVEQNLLAADLRALLEGADIVFHLAAQAGVRSSWGADFRVYTDNNVLATQRLLEAAKEASLGRFVYASTSSVYGDTDVLPMREDAICRPHSPYGVSKLAAEHLCYLYSRNFGVPTVALRFFSVYGPRQRPDMAFTRFIRAMLTDGQAEVYGDGHQTRDFTFVADIVEGTVRAAEAPPGEVFNLGGGSRVSLVDAVRTLEEVTGRKLSSKVAERQPGDVRDTWASLDKSRDVLGYEPRVGLAEGLARQVDWLEELVREQSDAPS